jgi:hypothetical protein
LPVAQPPTACGSFHYTSPVSNFSYMLNNCNNATFDDGETVCNSMGGHLVVYPSKADQDDAEGYYTKLGEEICIATCEPGGQGGPVAGVSACKLIRGLH